MPDIPVTPAAASTTQLSSLRLAPDNPPKTVDDWVRDMRMSADVN